MSKSTKIEAKESALRVLRDFVIVKQTMTKKGGHIITDAADSDKDKFDYTFEIVQKGPDCKSTMQIGEHPIFSQYVTFSGVKMIEKTDKKMISLIIVHENDIIAVDDDPIAS